jgi:hypothetical protein
MRKQSARVQGALLATCGLAIVACVSADCSYCRDVPPNQDYTCAQQVCARKHVLVIV